jgi:hypothetical protein
VYYLKRLPPLRNLANLAQLIVESCHAVHSLPPLPRSLGLLTVHNCYLRSLPPLPTDLRHFYWQNWRGGFPIALPPNLEVLTYYEDWRCLPDVLPPRLRRLNGYDIEIRKWGRRTLERHAKDRWRAAAVLPQAALSFV